ncbi:MAG: IclR family transcriptional regulator [Halorientalis sp.]
MRTNDTGSGSVSTVRTAFRIVNAVQELDTPTISGIAEHLGLAKSTVHRHVKTLQDEEFVIERNGHLEIGLRFLNHGTYAQRNRDGYQEAEEKVEEIATETGELCTFIVREQHMGYLLCAEKGPNAVETGDWVGKPVHLHATAGGKAILANMDRPAVESIIDRTGLTPSTNETITSKAALFDELDEIRAAGYAINREEHIDGLNAVAVPIRGKNDELLGTLVVSGPTNRVQGERLESELPDFLLGAANELELNLTYS